MKKPADVMLRIKGIADLRRRSGQDLGVSGWHRVTQDQVNAFACVTEDDNWIHLDAERAKHTPFGTTIAHGLLTLSLEPKFSYEIYEIVEIDYSLDYGYGKIRFPAPVPVGARLRMRSTLKDVTDVEGGVQCIVLNTIELEDSPKPACVTELILRVVGAG